jgi:predicted amidohydrolase
MSKIRIAVVQPTLEEGDVAGNWRKVRKALEQAGSRNANLVVLPEMWLAGYAYRRLEELAGRTPASLEKVGALARRLGLFVVGSWAERCLDGRICNTAHVVGPDGRVRSSYRKVHLFGPMKEDRHFAPGEAVAVADLEIGKVGVGLCYDLRFPELARKMALRGAELLLFPSQWPEIRLGHFHTLLAARAIENQLFTVGANRTGRNASVLFGGGSTVIGPRGEIVAQLGEEEGLIEADVDLGLVAEVREEISYLAGRVKDVDEFLIR